jgi:hypothetical protein
MARVCFTALGIAVALFSGQHAAAQWAATKTVPEPSHHCDESELGGDMQKTIEIADQRDSAPHNAGGSGNWYVTRTTKWIPYCIYHDAIGLYSLDSYALTPKIFEEEVQICAARQGGGSAPVAPFAGPCPPAG